MLWRIVFFLLVMVGQSQATTFYISPTGSNANDGLSTGAPFLTFAYALDASRASCGDTLILRNGTYGDGTSTGKLSITNRVCTLGNELIIQAQNQRQAKINDSGLGKAVNIADSAYITIDGLYARSADNTGTATQGYPFFTIRNTNITLKNLVARNPNRYTNTHVFAIEDSSDVLIENSEGYVFHRHCVEAWRSTRVTARQIYCNPRGGKIPGGFGLDQGPLGSGAAVVSMYPCRDCIQENTIADGTTHPMFLNEMNSTYGLSTPMTGSKVLGSICYKCNYSNGIFINSRNTAGLNNTPQNIVVRDVVFIDHDTFGYAVRVSDGVNITLDHISGLSVSGIGTTQNGIHADDNVGIGSTAAQNSLTMTNILMRGYSDVGFNITGFNTWTGDEVVSFSNATAFNPALPSNWTNASTADPGIGTCKTWIPVGAAVKGAGTGGSDIGANILYRTINGVLTTTPLWDPITGEFPHGADDLDGTNNVAGESLKDFHVRINVNTGGCSFPAGYGVSGPTNPATHVVTTNTTGPHVHTIPSGMDSITVGIEVRFDGSGVPAHADTLTSSCGSESIPALADATVTGSASGNRSVRIFGKINPTSGTCTLTPTFSTANWTGWVMISAERDGVDTYRAVAANTGLSTSPSVSPVTSTGDFVISFIATSNSPTLSACSGQTLTISQSHASVVLRAASSDTPGASGASICYSLSSSVYWALQAVAVYLSPSAPPTHTRTVTKYQIGCLRGPEASACVHAGISVSGVIATTGSATVRAEISGGVATSPAVGMHWYCRVGADAFTRVMDTYNGTVFKHTGNLNDPDMPGSGASTTQRLSAGNFVPGFVSRDETTESIPGITSTQKTEMIGYFDFNGVAGDVVPCRPQLDSGLALDAYTVTPTINLSTTAASTGF